MADTLFTFEMGNPGPEFEGRWLTGSVELGTAAASYTFRADLMLRVPFEGGMLHCNRVALDIGRRFRANDFWAFIEVLTAGSFYVTSSKNVFNCDPDVFDDLWFALNHAAVRRHLSPELPDERLALDLAVLGDQLKVVRKREFLSMALQKFHIATTDRPKEEVVLLQGIGGFTAPD
jgi:hypothetical protein